MSEIIRLADRGRPYKPHPLIGSDTTPLEDLAYALSNAYDPRDYLKRVKLWDEDA